jgi:hypothetical protein
MILLDRQKTYEIAIAICGHAPRLRNANGVDGVDALGGFTLSIFSPSSPESR